MGRTAEDVRSDRGKLWGRWLREQLKDRGLTQEQAARELDVTVSTFARWIAGRSPSFENLMTIQARWGVLPDFAALASARIVRRRTTSVTARYLTRHSRTHSNFQLQKKTAESTRAA